jgi:hypothetical protein
MNEAKGLLSYEFVQRELRDTSVLMINLIIYYMRERGHGTVTPLKIWFKFYKAMLLRLQKKTASRVKLFSF